MTAETAFVSEFSFQADREHDVGVDRGWSRFRLPNSLLGLLTKGDFHLPRIMGNQLQFADGSGIDEIAFG